MIAVKARLVTDETERILAQTCMDLGPNGYDTDYGWGLVNARDALARAVSCPGDLDGDRDVDLADLSVLLSCYGRNEGCGDTDGDRDTDLADLAILLANFGVPCRSTIYETDFSSDPGWVTNDPNNLYWDSRSGTFHGWQANRNTSYAYILLPSFDSIKSFRLEYDARINNVQWSAGLTFGLWDASLFLGKGVQGDFSYPDCGYVASLYATPKETSDCSRWWLRGIWYRKVIEYDATTGIVTLTTTDLSTGKMVHRLELQGIRLSSGYNRLGVSRLHMEGYNNMAVDYDLDNIKLHKIP